MPTVNNIEHPLAPLTDTWLRLIELSLEEKWKKFGTYAEETSNFYDSDNLNWMWSAKYAEGMHGFLAKGSNDHLPTFRIMVNKPFEAVALFGPTLFHRYPQVDVTPARRPQIPPEGFGLDIRDPMMAEQYQQYLAKYQFEESNLSTNSMVLQHYVNWLQVEADKKTQSRRGLTEAIVKGLGLLETHIHSPNGSQISYPRTRFLSCDDITKDPDADYAEDVQWVAIYRCHARNLVAQKFGLNESDLRGHMQSYESQATDRGRKEAKGRKDKKAKSYDLVEYWEIYSKNGFGHRLKTTDKTSLKSRYDFDWMGNNCYIVVSKGIPYPLNFPSWAVAESPDDQFQRAQWPIPYWTDEGLSNGWPFAELHFYEKLNCVWPISLIKPAIGEIRFVNWCMSFLADKVAASSTTYLLTMKAAGAEIRNQLQTGLAPYTMIEISELLNKSVGDLVKFLDAPSFSIDIWKMVAEVMELIDKRTGLTELIYGLTGVQVRSATEANIRDQNVAIRPDDMAERTEEFYSQTAIKEIEAAVWGLDVEDVRGILGDEGAMVFERIQSQDFEAIIRDYKYRVQAGSARKPNKNQRLRSLNEFGQWARDSLQTFAMGGQVGPWNAFMREMGKAMDMDASDFLLPEPQPAEQGPSEEEAEAEQRQEEHEQELDHREEKHDQEMEFARQKNRLQAVLTASQNGGNGR